MLDCDASHFASMACAVAAAALLLFKRTCCLCLCEFSQIAMEQFKDKDSKYPQSFSQKTLQKAGRGKCALDALQSVIGLFYEKLSINLSAKNSDGTYLPG